jgi:hypothetical protein
MQEGKLIMASENSFKNMIGKIKLKHKLIIQDALLKIWGLWMIISLIIMGVEIIL